MAAKMEVLAVNLAVAWYIARISIKLYRYCKYYKKLADEIFATDPEIFQISENREGNLAGVEECLRDLLYVGGGNGFDALDQLVQSKEFAEVHLLPGEVRHAA